MGRSGNNVAHNLAKHARHVRGCSVWMEDVPPHLSHVLFADHDWFYLIKVQSLDSQKKFWYPYRNPTKLGVYWDVIWCDKIYWILSKMLMWQSLLNGVKHRFHTSSLPNSDSLILGLIKFQMA